MALRPCNREKLAVFPDILEVLFLYVAGRLREVAARLDVTGAADEGDGLGGDAALAAAGAELEVAARKVQAPGRSLLLDDSVVVRRAGGAHQHLGLLKLHVEVPRS